MRIEVCQGCQYRKPITDVFDGTLCEQCRLDRGLLRPEESLETAPWLDENNVLARIRNLAGPPSIN